MATKPNESNLKLIEFSNQYSKFNKNQVLTETQLNGFLDYFDDQGRFTRTSLSGVGIVCGFKVSLADNEITITQGRGITTDGDLVTLLNPILLENGDPKKTKDKTLQFPSKTYTYYKAFFDNKEALYKKFLNPDKEQITLYELKAENHKDHKSLADFKVEEKIELSKMFVLLYVESYEKDNDLCNQLTCDNQGIEQIARVRVLLVSKTNADYIANQDSIFLKHNWYETYTNLPVVSTPRIVVNPRVTRSYTRLKAEYFQKIVGSGVLAGLREGLNSILKKFDHPIIPDQTLERIFAFRKANVPNDFQYRFDSLNDLIDTYNQIKELLLEMNVECCPTIGAFPKHLMLGKVVELQEYPTLRHQFYKSPIIPQDDLNYQKVISLLNRVRELLKEFNTGDKTGEVRITPSLDISVLSNKAIPFYYNVSNPLLKYWNFLKSRRFMEKLNLSYHRDKLANVPSVKNPLDYNLDPFDFYRIEGHQGRPYKDALRKINELKFEKGLNFDVKALSIETNTSDFDMQKYKCHFEDVRALFNAWKAQQECILEQIYAFFSAFSTTAPGTNLTSEEEGYNRLYRILKAQEESSLEEKQKDKQETTNEDDKNAEKEKEKEETPEKEVEVEKVETVKEKEKNKGKEASDDQESKTGEKWILANDADKQKMKSRAELIAELSESADLTPQEKTLLDLLKTNKGFTNIEGTKEWKVGSNPSVFDTWNAEDEEKNPKKTLHKSLDNIIIDHASKMAISHGKQKIEPQKRSVKSQKDEQLSNLENMMANWNSGKSTKKVTYSQGYNLSKLANLLGKEKSEENITGKIDLGRRKKITQDKWSKQEKQLREQFEDRIRYIRKRGANEKHIQELRKRFEQYLEDVKNGKTDEFIVVGNKEVGKGEVGKIDTPPVKEKPEKGKTSTPTGLEKGDTIGAIFSDILMNNPGAKIKTVIQLVAAAMTQIAESNAWNEEPELATFILDEAVTTLAVTHLLNTSIPENIERLSTASLDNFQEIVGMLCEHVKDMQTSFSVAPLEAGTRQVTELFINQLALICCSTKQLKAMQDEMQTRIDSILLKTRLFEFVKTHPGLEHKAGVRPGGTFVMVYLEGNEKRIQKTQTQLNLEFLEIPKVAKISDKMELQLWEEKLNFEFRFINSMFAEEIKEELLKDDQLAYSMVRIQADLETTVSSFARLLNKNFAVRNVLDFISASAKGNVLQLTIEDTKGIEGKGYFQANDPSILGTTDPFEFTIQRSIDELLNVKDRVIADFSLPYMCSSDCAPVNFVIPKDPPILRLPEKYVCLKDNEPVTPIPFSVSPEDGEIEAEVYGEIESGLTFDDDGNAFFDASLTDPILHGKEIGFKVDGEATNCTITVYAEPPLSVISEVRYDDELRTTATVMFTLFPVYPELTHTWTDGIGNTAKIQPDADGKVFYKRISLPVNEDNILKPTVTISNGFCEKLVEIEPIQFEDPITEVKLEIQNTYCIDNANGELTTIPFTLVEPEDLTIRLANEKVRGLEIFKNSLLINPDKFRNFYNPIEFTLGGLPTEATFIVLPPLYATIHQIQGDVIFKENKYYQEYFFKAVFDDRNREEGVTMIWEVDGVEVGQGFELTQNFLIEEEKNTHQIVLKASQEGGCATEVSTEVTVENPNFKLTLPKNRTKFCLSDETSYPITIFPESEGVVVEGLGVSYDDETDRYLFTPSQTGLSVAGIVPISIDGNTYLKLRVETIAIARFEVKIENREVVIINSSDDADEYIFNVGTYTETYTTKDTLRVSIDILDQEVIDVSLTTVTLCGKDVAKQTGVSLETTLELPVKSVCLKEGEQVVPLPFTVIPEGAKVAANVDDSLKSGLYYDENRNPFFDASMTNPKLYGNPIEFTLDGRKTDCAITVYPELSLNVNSFVSYNNTKTEAKVTFQVSRVYPDVEYIWSDSLGNEMNKAPNANGEVTFSYTNLPVNTSNTVEFNLKLVYGPCPTYISLDPITFDDPVLDFNLNIQRTFCIVDADSNFVKIPFTDIDPPGLPIEIVDGPIEGLNIDNDHLYIDVQKFNQFNKTTAFALDGNPTAANITIYPKFQVKIDSKRTGLKWENNQLIGTYFLSTILPNGMNTQELVYEWEINGQIVATKNTVSYDFPIYQSPMAYEVRLRVKQNGVCPMETSTIINLDYPAFSLSIPNNRLDYCFNDTESYEVSINPQVEGFVIEGMGMSRIDAEDRNVFTPDQADLPNGGSVPLSFDGLNLLTLNITPIPQARFAVEVTNEEVIVTNNSDKAERYIFMVGDKEYDYATKKTIRRKVSSFGTATTIDVTLRTMSPCGEGYAGQKGIQIKEDQSDPVDNGNCAVNTLKRIQTDNSKLPNVADLNLPPDVEYLVVDQTQFQYQNAMMLGMLDGGIFSDIITFGSLFNDTASNILKFKGDDKIRIALSQYLVAQAKLFFNILHCQPHDALGIEKQNIVEIMTELNGVLKRLAADEIQYDKDKELQNFLKIYMSSSNVIDFISNYIKNPLLPEVVASNNGS